MLVAAASNAISFTSEKSNSSRLLVIYALSSILIFAVITAPDPPPPGLDKTIVGVEVKPVPIFNIIKLLTLPAVTE